MRVRRGEGAPRFYKFCDVEISFVDDRPIVKVCAPSKHQRCSVNEPLTRLLKKHEINVVINPLNTLQQEFPIPKSRPPFASQLDVVSKIPCGSCF